MARARKQPTVHVEVVGSVRDRPMYERVMHWKPHIEAIYRALGYGDVDVQPTQSAIDEWEKLNNKKQIGA